MKEIISCEIGYLGSKERGALVLCVYSEYIGGQKEIKCWDVSDSTDAENTKNAVLKAMKGTPGRLNEIVFLYPSLIELLS